MTSQAIGDALDAHAEAVRRIAFGRPAVSPGGWTVRVRVDGATAGEMTKAPSGRWRTSGMALRADGWTTVFLGDGDLGASLAEAKRNVRKAAADALAMPETA